MRKFGHVNPYTEILARALYNKQRVVHVSPEDRDLVNDAVLFMNYQSYTNQFIKIGHTVEIISVDYIKSKKQRVKKLRKIIRKLISNMREDKSYGGYSVNDKKHLISLLKRRHG